MKSKNVIRNRLLTILFAIFFCSLVLSGLAGINFSAYADETTYKYELESVEVRQNPDWIFTNNTPDSMLYKMMSVTVTYKEVESGTSMDPYVLDLSSDGTAATGENVTFTRDTSAKTVTATVTPKAGETNEYDPNKVSGTSSPYTLEDTSAVVSNGITASFQPDDSTNITTSTQLSSTANIKRYIYVYETYNDGTVNENNRINTNSFNLTGNLFPTEYYKGISTYNKEITVEYGSEPNKKTAPVLITDITYEHPTAIYTLSGSLTTQMARSTELNLTGLNIMLQCGSSAFEVPASTFPAGYFTAQYYDEDYEEVVDENGEPLLNITVAYVELTFKYPDKNPDAPMTVGPSEFEIDVARISIHTPVFNTDKGVDRLARETEISWNGGASVDLEGWDFQDLHKDTGDAPNPQIKVYKLVTGKEPELLTESSADGDNGGYKIVDDVINSGKKTIQFLNAGSRYRIDVTLSEEKDFQWDSAYNGYINSDKNLIVSFEVQVEKGQPVVTLSDIINVMYGTPNSNGTLSATLEGEDMGDLPWKLSSNPNDKAYETQKDVWYYRLVYTDKNTGLPVTDLRSDGKPKNVGTYEVYAVTYENAGYKSATSDKLTFEITQFVINTGVNGPKEFNRVGYGIDEILTSTDSLPNSLDPTNYNEKITDILSLTYKSASIASTYKFIHVGTHTISLAVNGAYSANYKLQNASVNFTITTYKDSAFDFNYGGWSYGTVGANPNISISWYSDTYYPSKTGNLNIDFTITYHYYDSSKPNNVGEVVPEKDFSKYEVNHYVIVLTANKDASYSDETAETSGTDVDYILPVVVHDFWVTAADIEAPTLTAPWVLNGEEDAKEVYRYNESKSGQEYILSGWEVVGSNIAADGNPIITVTVTYTQFITVGNAISVTFADGKFTVNMPGNYTVTITLNKNYSWKTEDNGAGFTPDANEYKYIGYVARQQLTVLQNGDVSGEENTYTGELQAKTVGNWNENALTITDVTGTIINGSASVTGEIKKPDNTAGKPYSNGFSVTGAGNYQITVKIANQDDYEWADDEGGNGVSRSLTLEYTLKQATLKVTWENDGESGIDGTVDKSGSYPAFVFDGTAKRPTATAAVAFAGDNAEGMLTITGYKLYTDGTFGTEADSQTAISKGFYYVAVSDFGGSASVNYVLPDPLIAKDATSSDVATMFEISAFKLDAPLFAEGEALQNKQISKIYNGLDYDITKYIFNYSYYTGLLGSGGEASVKIEINGSQGTTAKTYEENGYTVKISINSNDFEWKEGAENRSGKDYYEFKFIIEQRMVLISWTNTTVDYNAEEIPGPSYEITNIAPDIGHTDDVYLVLTYTQGNADVSVLKDAGRYTVKAKAVGGLGGEDAGNYKIVDGTTDGTSNNSSPFTVRKLAVVKPVLPSGKFEDFDGIKYSQNIEFKKYYDAAGVTVAVSGEVPEKWFTSGYVPSADNRKLTVETINFSASTDKTLELIRAGVYTFTVSLNAKNYYWSDEKNSEDFDTADKYEYTLSNSFTIERKTLEAPYLGKNENRALEWDRITSDNPFASVFTLSVDGISYTVRYGKITDPETTSDKWLELDSEGKGKQGVYYAELTISVGAGQGHLLNYVWEPNGSDKNENGDDYLNGNADKFYYTEGKVSIRLVYAITRGQLDINIAVNGYTFGDNGVDGIATFDKTQTLGSDPNSRVYLTGTGVEFATGDNYAWIYEVEQAEGQDEIKLTFTDESDGHVLSDKELVHGLPWNAGSYTLRAVLRFGLNGGTYEDKRVSYTFTVEKCDITVEWSDLSLEYNGKNQMASAKITNVIKQDSLDTTDYTEGLTLTIGLVNGGTEHKNVAEYDVEVKAIVVGAGAVDNFKIPTAGLSTKFNITPKAVTVKGVEVSNHIYGDEISEDEKQFTDYDGFIKGDGAWEAVAVTICATDTTTPIGQYAPVNGTYYVRVCWNPEYEFYYNYTVEWDNSAAFVIKAREITVEWNNTTARSEYGQDVNLFTYISPTSASYGGVENAYAGKGVADIFVLTAYKGSDSLTLGSTTDAGAYTVTPTLTDEAEGNWIIHYIGEGNWQYVIYNAQISDPDNTITPVEGLEYSARDLKIFEEDSLEVELVNPELNKNTVKWQYGVVSSLTDTKDNVSVWEDMTDKNITRYTADTYYFVIKVTAKNHDEFTKTIEVTIKRATLNVQFNYTIMYGEVDPASKGILFDAVRTRPVDGIGWTVDLSGFKKYGDVDDEALFYSDKDFYNLNGNARYKVDNFAIGDFKIDRVNYTIVYKNGESKLFTLTCDNYEFNLTEGTLKVDKIKITVKGSTLPPVAYNGVVPAINTENVGYTVTHPASTYDKNTLHKPENGNYAEYIHVSSNAFSNPNKGSTTNSKGNYDLVVSADKSNNFYEIAVNNGSVEITATTLDVKTIGGYSGQNGEDKIVYDEKYYGLTVDAQETVNPENGKSLGIAFATASDGTDIIIKFYVADGSYTDSELNDSSLIGLTSIPGIPSYIDRGTYRIIYKIYTNEDAESDNYIPVYGYREIIITQGTNELESHFNFRNGTATKSSNFGDAQVSWTYGYMVEDGFYPEDDQFITDPAAKYKRANATDREVGLTYRLTYSKTSDGSDATIVARGNFVSVTNLFEKMFGADTINEGEAVTAGFNAGYYKLSVLMSLNDSDNFSFTTVEYVFQVAKRNLTITVDGKSTVYGEEAPKLTYKDSGLVSNMKGAAADTIDKAIGNTPSIVTEYVVGNHVGYGSGEEENNGKYSITVDNKVATAQNYVVTYTDNWLTLTKRQVTVTIENKESKYNFQDNTGPKELTFKLADSGSPYDIYETELVKGENNADDDFSVYNNANQKVITLITAAVKGDTTADVKFDEDGTVIGYTIYAVFNTEANGYAATDYLITFNGCDNKESEASDVIKDGDNNNAGSYVVKQATFDVDQLGLYQGEGEEAKATGGIYTGGVQYYKANLQDTAKTAVEFTYTKKDAKGVYQPIEPDQVKEVGDYYAHGSSANKNYSGGTINISFAISRATLRLQADTVYVQYGTYLSGNVATDNADGGAKASGRFDGFTYTASSEHLLSSIVESYQNNAVENELITYTVSGYSPSTPVGTTGLTINPACINLNSNIRLDPIPGTLIVKQREVEVTIVGWGEGNDIAWCYYQGKLENLQTKLNEIYTENDESYAKFISLDYDATFGASGDSYAALGIKLTLDTLESDVAEYSIKSEIDTSLNSKASNYKVRITNNEAGGTTPKFSVQKAKLTLYANTKNVTDVSAYSYSRIYGESIALEVARSDWFASDNFLRYDVSGLVDDQDFISQVLSGTETSIKVKFTVKCGDKDYAPWASTVKETYTVEIVKFGDIFKNYIIEDDSYISATLTITRRTIYASTTDQTFGFEGTEYNEGLYGKEHEAVISFADSAQNDEVDSVSFRPKNYTLSYDTTTLTKDGKNYQTAGKAPTVVREGGYKVTVTLDKDGNYTFANSSYATTLSFNIKKMSVTSTYLRWSKPSMATEDFGTDVTVISNYIAMYQTGYLKVAQFEFAPLSGAVATDIVLGDESTPGTYYFDEDGAIHITMNKSAQAAGTYSLRVELKDTAVNNIEFTVDSGHPNFISTSFNVTTKTVKMEITYGDFTYGGTPATLTVTVNESVVTSNLTLSYALITDSDSDRIGTLYSNSSDNNGLESSEVNKLKTDDLSIAPNFVAGYYLLLVEYNNGALSQSRYYVFRVFQKTISYPQIDTTGFTYNGAEQSIEVKYTATDMRPVFDSKGGSMAISDGKVTFTVTTVGSYSFSFVLVDSANTVWDKSGLPADGSITVSNNTVTYTWNVAKDESDNDVANPVISVKENILKITYGEVYDTGNIKLKSGYNGKITLYYIVRTDDIQPDMSADWKEYNLSAAPLGANSYWIKAVVSDLDENYSPKATICSLSIARKKITATVSGEITYGEALSDTHFTPVITGMLLGDGPANLGGYSYAFAEEYKIQAGGTYYIILDTDPVSKEVTGIDAGPNYAVMAEKGLLVVNKRNVTITIESDSSDYSVTPDTKAVKYSVYNIAPGEDNDVLGIEFTIGTDEAIATNRSAIGSYWITIKSYDDTNYVISYQRAVYTINPLQVEIQLDVQTDAEFGGDIWVVKPKENSLIISNPKADAAFVYAELSKENGLKLEYSGTSNSGIPVPDKSKAPSLAGTYLVKVVGASENYTLVGMPEFTFTINRKGLDDGLLVIENQTYNGTALTPVITVDKNAYTLDRFSFTAPECINANSYDVTVTLTDADNYQWLSTPGASVVVKFTVDKATDEETTRLTITGWQYGNYSAAVNSPSAQVKSGGTIYYEYSADGGKTYTSFVPENGNVGTYYVRVVVAESSNFYYFEGTPVSFNITKYLLTVPKLTSEDIVYTGDELIATISNFDSRYMSVTDDSEARTFLGAASITAVAVNAGVYKIYVALSDFGNFGWLENAGDAQGVLTLTWTIGKKKVELPTSGKNRFVVNGNEIVYIPEGFDESIMSIENNVYSYGGNFTAEIRLKDTSNYEWINGEETVKLSWHITGSETVFAIILSVLLLCFAAGAAGIATQLLLERRRKNTVASTISDIESKDTEENADVEEEQE